MTAGVREVVVEVAGLTRVYRGSGSAGPVVANDDLSFSVTRGQVFGLLGANGSGKTTLVSQLLGLVRPTSGAIRVAGVDVVADPESVKTISAFLPQVAVPMRMIEVRRALHYTGRLRGQSEVDARTQTAELIDELGLGSCADRHVNDLSGGMTRLVNFGMSLMGRPALLVLDEPTNELDPRNRRLVWDAVSRRSAGEGTTVVLVTHNVLEAERAVDRVAIMHQGRITAIGTPGELKERMDDRTRMELVVRGGGELTPGELRQLAVVGEVVPGGREGSYLVHSTPAQVPALVRVVTGDIGLTRLDDFRLARPTLEDVYLDLDRGATHAAAPDPVDGAVVAAVAGVRAEAAVEVEPVVVPPVARPPWRERVRRELVSFKYLWLEQMLEVRTTWSWTLLFGFLMPIAMVFGLTRIGDGLSDPKSLLYIASGAAIFSVATEGIGTLAQRVGVLKRDGMMVYYASLPISRAALLASMVLARLVLVLPGLVTPILAANVLYDAGFEVSPALLVVLPLTCLALSAVGLAIGMLIDDIELIVVITNLLIFVLLLAAPVLIPPESLPAPLRLISYLLPPTYAADALRGALTGDLGGSFPLDIAALVAMAVLGLLAATRWIRWRTA